MKVNVRYTNSKDAVTDYFWIDFLEAEEPEGPVPPGYVGLEPSTQAFYDLDNGSMISTGLWIAPEEVKPFREALAKYGMKLHRMSDAEIEKANESWEW